MTVLNMPSVMPAVMPLILGGGYSAPGGSGVPVTIVNGVPTAATGSAI